MAISIADAVRWKIPAADFDTINGKISAWRSKDVPQPDEVELAAIRNEYVEFLASTLYQEKRKQKYDPIPDQVERLTKALDFLQKSGVDIGPDGEEQVTRFNAVRAEYPKPEN